MPRTPRQRSPKPAEAADPELTRASLAAEMPAQVATKQEFAVRVRLSRNAIEATEGTTHEERDVEVDAERPLTAQVIGKSNAEVVGTDTDRFDLPSGGGTSELQFRLRAQGAGPVKVMIVVRQGSVLNTTITLTATAGSKAEVGTQSADDTVKTEVHSGIDAPELEGLPCLDIVEREERNGAVVFQYALRLLPREPAVTFKSARIKNRQRTISTILDDVGAIWKNTEAEPKEREQKLQDVGSKLFDELFPVEMQAYLWKHRAKLKNLIVYADEPFVPWELVHLKPPDGPRPTKPHFLAQDGLVRWHLNSFPPREIRVRKGHAKALVPEYRDPRFTLTEPVFERQFLKERFGASPVTATPTGVRALLRSGGFDLLHFSGHGAASSGKILDAKLLLQGRKRGGTVEPQYFGATTVSENAKATGKNGIGPVVVLNACQVGQAGELLTTVGGFAAAFLDAGASAFVSCLWSVQQQPSRIFVEKLYDELLDGTPMGTASARAREATRKAGDATWLAFVVYARPDAVLVRS